MNPLLLRLWAWTPALLRALAALVTLRVLRAAYNGFLIRRKFRKMKAQGVVSVVFVTYETGLQKANVPLLAFPCTLVDLGPSSYCLLIESPGPQRYAHLQFDALCQGQPRQILPGAHSSSTGHIPGHLAG